MFDQASINTFLNQVKMIVDNLTADKGYPKELMPYLYLIAAGMISNYGMEYINSIYNLFKNVNIVVGSDKLLETIPYHERDRIDQNTNSKFTPAYTLVKYKYSELFKVYGIEYKVCIKDLNTPNKLDLLESLAHELNHILNSLFNTFFLNNNSRFARCGMMYTNLLTGEEQNRMINEVINTLQTEDIIKCILDFNDFIIEDDDIRRVLSYFKGIRARDYTCNGYDLLVNQVRDLYEDSSVKKLVNNSMLLGTTDDIVSELDSFIGDGTFSTLNAIFDKLGELFVEDNADDYYEMSRCIVGIRDIVHRIKDKKISYGYN